MSILTKICFKLAFIALFVLSIINIRIPKFCYTYDHCDDEWITKEKLPYLLSILVLTTICPDKVCLASSTDNPLTCKNPCFHPTDCTLHLWTHLCILPFLVWGLSNCIPPFGCMVLCYSYQHVESYIDLNKLRSFTSQLSSI